ncbi:MAG TPA: hypothetical protein VFU23_09905 [Gemmatimonadales bacterium]|nr:hypothetical protein [Gemmatimonadales bacterium]
MDRHEGRGMIDEPEAPYSILCSACYQPCSGAEAHVVPGWNPGMRRVWTTYRCEACWRGTLAYMRTSVSTDPEVRLSFCDFLERRGFGRDAETIRAAEPAQQETWLLRVLDAIESRDLVLEP